MAAGSFAIADEQKPQAMTIEFPALPTGPSRDKKMEEHGRLSWESVLFVWH